MVSTTFVYNKDDFNWIISKEFISPDAAQDFLKKQKFSEAWTVASIQLPDQVAQLMRTNMDIRMSYIEEEVRGQKAEAQKEKARLAAASRAKEVELSATKQVAALADPKLVELAKVELPVQQAHVAAIKDAMEKIATEINEVNRNEQEIVLSHYAEELKVVEDRVAHLSNLLAHSGEKPVPEKSPEEQKAALGGVQNPKVAAIVNRVNAANKLTPPQPVLQTVVGTAHHPV
jgi:ribosome assembly protein YihI (activator of Der GTPase)